MYKNIQDFINTESNLPHNIILRNFIIMILLSSVPTALLGKYAHITTLLILPIALYFVIWAIALLIRPNRGQFYLYWGLAGIYLSAIFMLGAYKVLSAASAVNSLMVLIAILVYFLVAAITCIVYSALIKNGRISKMKYGSRIASGAGAIVLIGMWILRYMTGNSDLAFFSYLLLFLGYTFHLHLLYLFKYHYIRWQEKMSEPPVFAPTVPVKTRRKPSSTRRIRSAPHEPMEVPWAPVSSPSERVDPEVPVSAPNERIVDPEEPVGAPNEQIDIPEEPISEHSHAHTHQHLARKTGHAHAPAHLKR